MIALGPVTSRPTGVTYSAQQVLDMIVGPTLNMRWVFDLLSHDLTWKADMTPYILHDSPPSIEMDRSRDVVRQLKLNMRAMPNVDLMRDLVNVRYQLQAPPPDYGWLQWRDGPFSLEPASRSISEAQTEWEIVAPDLSQLLSDDGFGLSYALDAGTSYAAGVSQIVNQYQGPTRLSASVPELGTKLPASLGWEPDASRLKAANDTLAAMSFAQGWMRRTTFISYPLPDWSLVQPAAVFDLVAGHVQVYGPFKVALDPSTFFNRFQVLGEDPRRQPLRLPQPYENANPDSDISTVRWHPRLKVIRDSKLADLAACQARARAEAQAAAMMTTNFELELPPWPFTEPDDVYQVTYKAADEGIQPAKYLVVGGTHVCQAESKTHAKLQKVLSV